MLSWEEAQRSQLALAGTAIGIRPFLAVLGWESVEVRGLVDVRSQLTWPGLNWQEWEGRGQTTYRGSFQSATGGDWISGQGASLRGQLRSQQRQGSPSIGSRDVSNGSVEPGV